jgi:hypothetical protein
MSVDAALQRLADALIERTDDIVEEYIARVQAEVPEFFASGDPTVVEATRESARANYVMAFDALRAGREVPDAAPPAAVEEARVAAELGMPVESVLKTYYVGHSTGWAHILTEVERLGLDANTRTAVLQLTSRYAFAYIERLSMLVTHEHARARESLVNARDRRRVRAVRDLLEGLPISDADLGYPLSCWHLAAIAWGEQADRAIAALAEAGYEDLWRRAGAAGDDGLTAPTPHGGGREFSGMRLDYLLGSPALAERATSCRVVRGGAAEHASDHHPVVAEFALSLTGQGSTAP